MEDARGMNVATGGGRSVSKVVKEDLSTTRNPILVMLVCDII